jgi:hypothetical protein
MAKKTMSLLELVEMQDKLSKLTKREFNRIRNHGTEEELMDAIERMNEVGGYDALDD